MDGGCVQAMLDTGERSLLQSLIGAGTSELWLAVCRVTRKRQIHWESKNGSEKLLRGVWYIVYRKLSV